MSNSTPPAAAATAAGTASSRSSAAAADRLRADVQGYLDDAEAVTGREVVPRRAEAVVVPYDPYGLAGSTAGVGFAAVEVPALCIVVTMQGARADATVLPPRGTLLGEAAPDADVAAAIARGLAEASRATADEALEAVLPFLQVRNPDTRVVAVRLASDEWEPTRRAAGAIAAAVAGRRDVLLVAASNMSRDAAGDRRNDRDALVLEQALALDGRALLDTLRRESILIHGAPAVACACEYARLRGARAGELVAYSHSGIATGHEDRVTGYAAVLLGAE